MWANRPWGDTSIGRIVHGANRPAFGRNVHGAKSTVGETSGNRSTRDISFSVRSRWQFSRPTAVPFISLSFFPNGLALNLVETIAICLGTTRRKLIKWSSDSIVTDASVTLCAHITLLGVKLDNRLGYKPISVWANRPWGESSSVWAKRPWGERYSGRNVLLSKRTVGLSPICTLSLSKNTQRSIAQIIFNESNYDIRRT